MADYTTLVTSEHQKPNFLAWLATLANGQSDTTTLIQSLPSLFDIDNAVGQQLDIVGQWIGFGRQVSVVLSVGYYGFADDPTALGFGELGNPAAGGRYIEIGESGTSGAILQDPEYRTVLKAKIIQNQYGGTIGELEAAVQDILGGVQCFYYDPGTRSVMILVTEVLDPVLTALLGNYDLLPRPAGVRYQIVYPNNSPSWSTVGTANVTGSTVSKPSGSNAWDSSAFVASPASHIFLLWQMQDTNGAHDLMGGLSTNPSGSPNFPSLNFGIECQGSGIFIWESGVSRGQFGNFVPGDYLAVYFDGAYVVYLHIAGLNVTVLRTVLQGANSYSPMFSLFGVGSSAFNVLYYSG